MHIIQASVISLFIGSLFVSTEEPRTPYVLILGTAQDGGLPQLACTCGHCQAARADSKRARHIASLLIVDPERGRRWLIDATPDLRRQYDLAAQLGAVLPPSQRAERNKIWFTHLNHTNPLVDSASDASKRVRQAGFHVARDGDQLKL